MTAFGNTSSAIYSSDTTVSSQGSSMGSSIAHSPGGSSVTVSAILLPFPVLVTSGKLCFYPFSNFFQSPFHDALATNPIDVSEFQPLNVIESLETSSRKSSSGYSSRSSSGKFKKKKRNLLSRKK